MRREYNGLTGEEVGKLALIDIKDIFEREGRLSPSQVYHNVTIRLELEIDSYPHEPKVETVRATVGAPAETPAGKRVTKKVKRERVVEVPDLARDEIETSANLGSSVEAVMSA